MRFFRPLTAAEIDNKRTAASAENRDAMKIKSLDQHQ